MRRLAFVTLLLVACSSKRSKQDELAEAQGRAATAQAEADKARLEAAIAQHDLDKALADQKAAEQDKLDIEKELADAQAQTKELIALAIKKVEALKKQRAALAAGPERKAIDDQIEQLEKVIRDTTPAKSP